MPDACLSEDVILGFVAREIGEVEVARVDAHMAECADCRGLVAEVARGSSEIVTGDVTRVDLGAPTEGTGARASENRSGETLGRYRLLTPLGAGGMGVVYEAEDPELGRKVALKLLKRVDGASEAWQSRLLREARAMARLSHPNVVAVYDVGVHDGEAFVAMELVLGTTLKHWLASGPHPFKEVVRLLLDAGRGLLAAHDAGLVHRDFKPDNVLIGADGRARVTDFGLARGARAGFEMPDASASSDAPRYPISASMRITQTGALVGTPAYMAPEQFAGTGEDARADQFAFAVALYEGLFGNRPFRGRSIEELMTHVRGGKFAETAPNATVPREVRELVLVALNADPALRHPSMHPLLEGLERASRASETAPPPALPPRFGKTRLRLAAAGALAVVFAGFVWILAPSSSSKVADASPTLQAAAVSPPSISASPEAPPAVTERAPIAPSASAILPPTTTTRTAKPSSGGNRGAHSPARPGAKNDDALMSNPWHTK